MKFLQYFYYKVFKTYNSIHQGIKLSIGPAQHAINFVTIFLFSVVLWPTLKFNLWNARMEMQFTMTIIAIFSFFGLSLFIEKKVKPGAVNCYKYESKSNGIIGTILLNTFLMLYTFLWFYTL